ncbi:MAG: single-stranded DNA-binding protein [Flavobacteriaceae bacterium]|nr:single-stranded DNA-binding protein [Flavobacteriaceae bacterium]
MSGTLNKAMLIGHTGTEVKMHYFEGGGSVGNFSLATNETYTNRTTGEKVTNTEWHNIVVRNKGAEICEKYLKKGDKVYIEGRLKTRKWQDDKGIDRYSTEIQCTDFTFLTPKADVGNSVTQNPVTPKSEPTKEAPKNPDSITDESSDLPF